MLQSTWSFSWHYLAAELGQNLLRVCTTGLKLEWCEQSRLESWDKCWVDALGGAFQLWLGEGGEATRNISEDGI